MTNKLAIAFFLATTACVKTDLTPEGAKVRITANPEAVHGCKFVGEVKGDGEYGAIEVKWSGGPT